MESVLVIVGLVLVAALLVWVIRRMYKSTKQWEVAYLIRFKELKNSLPPSSIFPALLINIDYPSLGRAGYSSTLSAALMYVKGENLILERVIYDKTPDKARGVSLVDRPLHELTIKPITNTPVRNVVGANSYELSGPIYQKPDGKRRATGLYLIQPSVFLANEVTDGASVFNKRVDNPESQAKLLEYLVHSGVKSLNEELSK